MNHELEDYLKNARKRELLKRGLYDVKYYTEAEAKNKKNENNKIIYYNGKYMEFIPYEISDEEYNEVVKTDYIKKYTPEYNVIKNSDINLFSNEASVLPVLLVISGVLILILGLIAAISNKGYILIIIPTIMLSIIFFALAKIIHLLEKARNNNN